MMELITWIWMLKHPAHLDMFLDRLLKSERELLPRRKRRALEEMTAVLSDYCLEASKSQDQSAFEYYTKLLDVLKMNDSRFVPDWGAIADRWLDLITPCLVRETNRSAKETITAQGYST